MASAGTLKFALVVSAEDRATKGLRVVAGAFDKVKAAGDRIKSIDMQKLHDARENIADFTARLRGGIEGIFAASSDVDAVMVKLGGTISALDGVAVGAMGRIKASAVDWSAAHKGSVAEYIASNTSLLATLKDEEAAAKATQIAMRFASATQTEAAAATKGLALVYAQMGDRTADVGTEFTRLSDVLTRGGQVFSQLNTAELFDPLKDAAPAARAAGVSLEQVVVVLGQFNAAGLQGGEAGAGLKSVLESLAPASEKLGFTIAKTASGGVDLVGTLRNVESQFGSIQNMSPETAAKLQEAFGPDAFRGLTFALGQTGAMTDALGKIETSAGAAAAAQVAVESTVATQSAIAGQQLDALKVELAAGLVPALQAVLPLLTPMVLAVASFVREHPQVSTFIGTLALGAVALGSVATSAMSAAGFLLPMVGVLLKVAGAVGGFASSLLASLVPALGGAITAAWSFTAALLANPITWIVIAIVAAVALIYIYWEPISEFFAGLWDGIVAGFEVAWGALKGAWNAVVGFFDGIFGEVRAAFQESFVGGIFKVFLLLNPLTWIVRAFAGVNAWLISLWPTLRDGAIAGLRLYVQTWLQLGTWIVNALVSLPGLILGWSTRFYLWLGNTALAGLRAYVGMWTQLGTWLVATVSAIPGRVVAFFTAMGQTLLATFGGVGQAIFSGITNDINRVLAWLRSFSLADAGSNIVNTLTAGIRAAAAAPYEAMQAIVQKVRNLLPFSPAKEGPLRDLHRVKLVETVAEAVRPAPLVSAMSSAAGLAMSAMADVPVPELVPVTRAIESASAERAANANAAPVTMSVNIEIGAGASPQSIADFDRWIGVPGNVERLAARLEQVRITKSRRKLG